MQQVWATLGGKLSNSVSEVHGTQDFGGYQVTSYNLNFFVYSGDVSDKLSTEFR